MRAAVLRETGPIENCPLAIEEVAKPEPGPNYALLKVRACGVCRTDLHVVEGDLKPRCPSIIPGHQIVANVLKSHDPAFPPGTRVGVSWIGGVDGTCRFCQSGRENLCDAPVFTGYTYDGGFAEYATARTDFLIRLPPALDDEAAAPLLCAGIIGYRSLRIANVKHRQHVGLFGFGSSAQLMLQVLHAWDCKVYVSTRDSHHRSLARKMGATWVGEATELPPRHLDAAVTFAPSGDVVLTALRSLDKGGIVAINAIHLDRMPQFDYDSLLWGERELRSVTNMTRKDAHDFISLAAAIKLQPAMTTYRLDQVNEALLDLKQDRLCGTAVIVPTATANKDH
jgi:propanol-preferring alcohol dehydrogenase